jgi:hypothetical protein
LGEPVLDHISPGILRSIQKRAKKYPKRGKKRGILPRDHGHHLKQLDKGPGLGEPVVDHISPYNEILRYCVV